MLYSKSPWRVAIAGLVAPLLLLTIAAYCILWLRSAPVERNDRDWSVPDFESDHSEEDGRSCAQWPRYESHDLLERCDGPYPRYETRQERLTCWPSGGGFWTAGVVHPVILDKMGIQRLANSSRSISPAEEDVLCQKMLPHGLGMSFYPDTDAYRFERHEIEPLTMSVREAEAWLEQKRTVAGSSSFPMSRYAASRPDMVA
jgi:hypothetical protein